ncbi:unnamed protein product [Trichobilharzia regenti]|nr:unnamed protein product [Trichobilharzia regenti]
MCDTPALSIVQQTVGHNRKTGCDKCEVMGCRLDADDVELHGPLEGFSAFPFELYMRKIRQSVHCGYAVAKQAAQCYVEHMYLMKITSVKHVLKEADAKGIGFSKGKLTYLNNIFTSYSPDNVILALGKPGNIVETESEDKIRFRPYYDFNDNFISPFKSRNLGIFRCSKFSQETHWISYLNIVRKCTTVPTTNDEVVIPCFILLNEGMQRKVRIFFNFMDIDVATCQVGCIRPQYPDYNIFGDFLTPIPRH